ncbi:MAG TPA: Na+/H+ antiporter NhaC family protein [Patescibacteria group bacterium]|nr:Na+/H+ antiporter NhaC family protein [Patescibacteria group bacterium]
MEMVVAFSVFFAALLSAVSLDMSIVYPLVLGVVCFALIAVRRGFGWVELGRMMLQGMEKSLIVIKIFVLIGAITAVWRACGTIAFIVYYGMIWMHPQYFLLCAFLLCGLVSFLLGTSFGTVGTVGVVLMVMAKSGHVDVSVAAGAMIAGAYVGDRCSPMSSSANLVAVLTHTDLYRNISNMLKTSWLPLVLSAVAYTGLSWLSPMTVPDTAMTEEILRCFRLPWVVVLPAAIVLVLAVFRVDVKLSMGISILAGFFIGLVVQGWTVGEMLKYLVWGYTTADTGFFAGVIQGGGLYSMLKVTAIVLISSAYAGIFSGTGLLREVENFFALLSRKTGVYSATVVASVVTAAFSCNQTLAVMLTHQCVRDNYKNRQLDGYRFALDMENTVILISALVPWNIAGAVPAAALGADAGFIPYAVYLFLVPLVNWFLRDNEKI